MRLRAASRTGLTSRVAVILGATAILSSAGDPVVLGGAARPAPPAPAAFPAPRTGYVETGLSDLVLIETYVTDGKGNPVRGLTKEDFILEVGSYRRSILSVDYREIGPEPEAVSGERANAGPHARTQTWPRRIVLFFEDNTSSPIGMTAARKAAARFLESGLAPSDEVAVAAYDMRLHYLQGFTADRTLLTKAVEAS